MSKIIATNQGCVGYLPFKTRKTSRFVSKVRCMWTFTYTEMHEFKKAPESLV